MTADNSTVQSLPVLPLKNAVLLPGNFLPFFVYRQFSSEAVEAALLTEEKNIALVAQKDSAIEKPKPENLYTVGTRAVIKKANRSPKGLEFVAQGIERVSILGYEQSEPYLKAKLRRMDSIAGDATETEALKRAVIDLMKRITQIGQPQEAAHLEQIIANVNDSLQLGYLLTSMLSLDVSKEQQILEANSALEVLRLLHSFMQREIEVLEVQQKISQQTQAHMNKQQRDYILRQQLRAIQEELGETGAEEEDTKDLRRKLDEAQLPDEARKEAERELGRLGKLTPTSPEHPMIRAYIEFLLDLPWNKSTPEAIDLSFARQVLDEDHYDLEGIKDRILEHLAVLKLNPSAKAPILCFVGPPGVGKTSLGQSIARALGRKFERLSLGGLSDEAELRGHRRTYIGALPGRILQAVQRAGANNPLIMLDEVDKLSRSFRGDPAAALLEILDPAQNNSFHDNYLNLSFDLSHVFFITTANTLDTIPGPLFDRMETLRLSGYSEEEKLQIARRYIIPRQLNNSGLNENRLRIPDEALRYIISRYTREAGVRELERTVGRLSSKVARRIAEGQVQEVEIEAAQLADYLGPERFHLESARQQLQPGVATGLAWTPSGGDILYVEAILLPGSQGLRLTGQLGEVMRESAKAAQSYLWSHAAQWGLDSSYLHKTGVHIHVPAGATRKDGPSAGVALMAALTSAFLGTPCRSDTAMTGEITLSGLVLPVGGITEKVLAAKRAGLKRVVLPKANQSDLRDLPDTVIKALEFVFVDRVEDALAAVLSQGVSEKPMGARHQPTAAGAL